MYYLGGHKVTAAGWLGGGIYLDFITVHENSLWQLYANRRRIGVTRKSGERRVVGQLLSSLSPAPLTLVRVDPADQFTDFGPELPLPYFNRWEVVWTTADTVNVDHFDVIDGDGPGDAVELARVLGRKPFTEDGTYRFELNPFASGGTWNIGIVPRDAAGNAGTTESAPLVIMMPPPDLTPDRRGNRFSLTAEAGLVTASFTY